MLEKTKSAFKSGNLEDLRRKMESTMENSVLEILIFSDRGFTGAMLYPVIVLAQLPARPWRAGLGPAS